MLNDSLQEYGDFLKPIDKKNNLFNFNVLMF